MEDNPEAGKKAAKYGAEHKDVSKAAWNNPNKSEKIIDYSENHGDTAKRVSRKASQNKATTKKAWNNPEKAKSKAKDYRSSNKDKKRARAQKD